MARQRQEDRRELTHFVLNSLKGRPGSRYLVWDTKAYHMAVAVYPSGTQVFYFIYSKNGCKHWHKIDKVGLADARAEAARLELDLRNDRNPQVERAAVKDVDTFAKVYERYLDEKLKPNNKSWEHTNYLIQTHVLPQWGKREISTIVRKDALKLHSHLSKDRPILANSVLAAASAVFSWGIYQEIIPATHPNPCRLIRMNPSNERTRVLDDNGEVPQFWRGCDLINSVAATALRVMLFTGQRGKEVRHMRWEHIKAGWWEMPGKPVKAIGWPGTKTAANNRVWLCAKVRELIAGVTKGNPTTGFVFRTERGKVLLPLSKYMKVVNTFSDPVRPHDLRRTFATLVEDCGFEPSDADRILNHALPRMTRIYSVARKHNRGKYAAKNKLIMESVANHIMALVDGRVEDNVIVAEFRKF